MTVLAEKRMPRVVIAPAIQRHVPTPDTTLPAATVADALAGVFETRPALRAYLLDDQGALRRHVAVFVDGQAVRDRRRLSDAVGPESEIYVVQALSGG